MSYTSHLLQQSIFSGLRQALSDVSLVFSSMWKYMRYAGSFYKYILTYRLIDGIIYDY